jgi:hypothetical protein
LTSITPVSAARATAAAAILHVAADATRAADATANGTNEAYFTSLRHAQADTDFALDVLAKEYARDPNDKLSVQIARFENPFADLIGKYVEAPLWRYPDVAGLADLAAAASRVATALDPNSSSSSAGK